MYNRVYNNLIKNNILYSKQFGFKKENSREYAIIQLIDQINNNFENNEFTIGVFIDLSKAFDTDDHQILLKKLIHYEVATISTCLKVTLQIVNNSYLLITKIQILQILPVEFHKDQYLGLYCC